MRKMLFDLKQNPVTIVSLPNGKYDVTVLDNEEIVDVESYGGFDEEVNSQKMYRYDGNIFRTVYELTEEEILGDMQKWLDYSSDDEPTLEQLKHDNDLIDRLTMELIEGGIL